MTNLNSISLAAAIFTLGLMCGCAKREETDRVEYTTSEGKKTSNIHDLTEGKASYRISGNQQVPTKAQQLHREARAKGESGDYAAALLLLQQSSAIAPNWPYPTYDMAFTYLLQGDMTNALRKYREVDRLEPKGFFTTKTAVWTLEREEEGAFPKGTYLAFVSLEWSQPEEKRNLILQMTTNLPAFAPAWKERAFIADGTDEQLALFEKALNLHPDPETYGICVLNKAALMNRAGKAAEAKRMVETLAQDDLTTDSTKILAKEMLKKFSN